MVQHEDSGKNRLDRRPSHSVGRRAERATATQWILLACLSAAILVCISRIAADVLVRRWLPLQDGACATAAVTSLFLLRRLVSRTRFYSRTIRSRLLLAFVALSLLSVIGATVGSIVVGYIAVERQAVARLESLAGERELRIREWSGSLANELRNALGDEYALDRARVSLRLSKRDEYYPLYSGATRARLRWFASQSQVALQYYLVDDSGVVVLSTGNDDSPTGEVWSTFGATEETLPFVWLPFCTSDLSSARAVAALPVNEDDGTRLGTLAASVSLDGLFAVLRDQTGLGESGKAYLLDSKSSPIARSAPDSLPGPTCSQPEIQSAFPGAKGAVPADGSGGHAEYTDYRGVRVIGASRSLPNLDAVLIVEQDLGEALSGIYTIVVVNEAIALVLVLVAVLASLFVTRSITTPLVDLSRTAARITAGDLSCEAVAQRDDEVGSLAFAFNTMTSQLRELIGRLEERVADRTRALQNRAVQLETCASVSREITSILAIDDLLGRVVERIREAFGYYQVEAFLVDDEQGGLVSRAVSGPANQPGRRVRIDGRSLNGRAVSSREAVLIDDYERDGDTLRDSSLPDTRSELIVPLRVAGQVVGTLDVQSAHPQAFSRQDALVIQGLGDQIAIAIQNARLYERSRGLAVVEERNRLARELHDSVTQSLYSLVLFAEAGRASADGGHTEDAADQFAEIGDTAEQALREMRLQLYQLRPLELAQEGLAAALRRRLDTVERRSGIDATLDFEAHLQMPDGVQDAFYRIALEALNNVVKHSGATTVRVTIRTEDAQLVLDVGDNGRGFHPPDVWARGGMGLATMRERAEALGGCLSVDSQMGQGTTVTVRLPRISGSQLGPS